MTLGPVHGTPLTLHPNSDTPAYPRTQSRAHIIPPDDDHPSPGVFATDAQPDPHTSDDVVSRPDNFFLSTNPFGPSTTITVSVKGTHAALGLHLISNQDTDRIILESCAASNPAARIPRWRSTLR